MCMHRYRVCALQYMAPGAIRQCVWIVGGRMGENDTQQCGRTVYGSLFHNTVWRPQHAKFALSYLIFCNSVPSNLLWTCTNTHKKSTYTNKHQQRSNAVYKPANYTWQWYRADAWRVIDARDLALTLRACPKWNVRASVIASLTLPSPSIMTATLRCGHARVLGLCPHARCASEHIAIVCLCVVVVVRSGIVCASACCWLQCPTKDRHSICCISYIVQ